MQLVNVCVWVAPNAVLLRRSCQWFDPFVVWCAFVSWTCWNTIFLIMLIEAHNCAPWEKGRASAVGGILLCSCFCGLWLHQLIEKHCIDVMRTCLDNLHVGWQHCKPQTYTSSALFCNEATRFTHMHLHQNVQHSSPVSDASPSLPICLQHFPSLKPIKHPQLLLRSLHSTAC